MSFLKIFLLIMDNASNSNMSSEPNSNW